MLKNRWMTAAVMMLVVSTVATAQGKKKERPELAPITDDANLPRVLLIGDSISMGYTIPTRKMLEGKANVHRIPTNGGPTSNGVKNIDKWLGDGKWDVIHFNWGLHDIKIMEDGEQQVPLDEYETNLRQLVEKMKGTGAVLIWASTTPVPDGAVKPVRRYADVEAYNKVAEKIMKENGVMIDDLYGFAKPQLAEIQLPVNVHYTPKGSKVLATQVTKSLEEGLAKKGTAKSDASDKAEPAATK